MIQNSTDGDTHLQASYLSFQLTHFAVGRTQFVLKAGDLTLLGLNFSRKVATRSLR